MTESNGKQKKITVAEVYDEVMKLSTEERAKLHQLLVKDKEQYAMDPEIERAAIAECERRVQMVREGKMELIDADEVIRQARKNLDRLPE